MRHPTSHHPFPWAGLVLAVALASGCQSISAVAEVEPARFEADIRAFEAADTTSPPAAGGTLFVGSSSIRLWNLEASFPGRSALNRGYGGSHISDNVALVSRTVLKYRPGRIIFYAGDNDIAHGKRAERLLADWKRFAAAVHAELPRAQLIFLAIKPSPARWDFWPEARRANTLIQAYCASDERLAFVDTATPMLDPTGRPRPELYVEDRLHLSPAGYELWTSLVEGAVR